MVLSCAVLTAQVLTVQYCALLYCMVLCCGVLQGILDKLVCMGSQVFIFAPPECGGPASSYTRSILAERLLMGRPSRCWACGGSDKLAPEWTRLW